jgi:hypothetical protein
MRAMLVFFALAFVGTLVLSRAAWWLMWLMWRWDGGMLRLWAAHLVSFALCYAWFAFGAFDGKVYLLGGVAYLLPQGAWLAMDFYRGKGEREELG